MPSRTSTIKRKKMKQQQKMKQKQKVIVNINLDKRQSKKGTKKRASIQSQPAPINQIFTYQPHQLTPMPFYQQTPVRENIFRSVGEEVRAPVFQGIGQQLGTVQPAQEPVQERPARAYNSDAIIEAPARELNQQPIFLRAPIPVIPSTFKTTSEQVKPSAFSLNLIDELKQTLERRKAKAANILPPDLQQFEPQVEARLVPDSDATQEITTEPIPAVEEDEENKTDAIIEEPVAVEEDYGGDYVNDEDYGGDYVNDDEVEKAERIQKVQNLTKVQLLELLDVNNIKKTGPNGRTANKEQLKENYINNTLNKGHGGYRKGSGRKKKKKASKKSKR